MLSPVRAATTRSDVLQAIQAILRTKQSIRSGGRAHNRIVAWSDKSCAGPFACCCGNPSCFVFILSHVKRGWWDGSQLLLVSYSPSRHCCVAATRTGVLLIMRNSQCKGRTGGSWPNKPDRNKITMSRRASCTPYERQSYFYRAWQQQSRQGTAMHIGAYCLVRYEGEN